MVVFLVFGACYLFLVVMAMHGIGDHDLLPLHWQALGGFAVTSLVTYLVFWLYFFDPGSGHVAVCMVAVVAILAFFHYRKRPAPPIDYAPVVMTILIAFLYLGITHFVALDEPLDYIAQARFRYVLPSDNSLSGDFAGMLFNGQAAKNIGTDWLTSDRPPLQTGWTLLCYGAGKMLGFPVADVGGWSGFWLQIAWVSAAYGLLREARLSVLRACAWTSLLAFSGFFLLNTVFVWPKLSASALGMGVFGLWIGAGRDKIPTKHFLAGGLFASLAWLSHGGIAFSFLTLGVWAFWRLLRRREWRGWGTAAAVFLLLALPWTAFQKFYAPPANRLFKWHLGGQVAVDLRSARETIHSAYSRLSTDEIVAAKINNFKMQVVGRFSLLWNLSERSTTDRRHEEFFYLFRALTWWIVGLAPAIFTCFLPGEISSRMLWGLLLWTASTVILWCLLMFDGAVIHQGSYAAVTGIFIACSLGLARFHRYTFPPFAIVIVAYTACTWWGPPQQLSGPINPVAAAIVALTLLPLIALGMASVAETLVARPHRIYTSNQNIAV
ncbi:MAG: hypothetical protein H7343_13900 [Undibacterium sp.]|nr:hypothetical protein [Opitutaceae bacterium]